jgi:DNA-binding NarL/FixJ family response regulator
MEKIKILLADDHLIFTGALVEVLNRESDMIVAQLASSGTSVLQILQSETIDMILLDINMRKMNGIATLQKIKQLYAHIKVVMLTTYDDAHIIANAKREGASGYIIKSSNIIDLLEIIRSVQRGEFCFPSSVVTDSKDIDSFSRQFFLTPREKEIVALIGQYKTNQEIADALFLSIYTVETHRKNIMDKLGIKKPGMLISYIHQHELIINDLSSKFKF